MPTPPGQSTFRLEITLKEIGPPIWRRLLVPGSIRLAKLHDVFQAAMGWTNSHLHSFRVGEGLYGMHFDDYPEEEIDEKEVSVLQVLRGHKSFIYEYDFGGLLGARGEGRGPHLVSRRAQVRGVSCWTNACPSEDCGGVSGYEHLLEVLADPSHEEYQHLVEWVGGSFDASTFDLGGANAALRQGVR